MLASDTRMSSLEQQALQDPLLAKELEGLSAEQRRWLEADLILQQRAAAIAAAIGFDERGVYHQLKQLRRTPLERLRRGLAHGRRRPRIPQ